jgi:hypothetical protein
MYPKSKFFYSEFPVDEEISEPDEKYGPLKVGTFGVHSDVKSSELIYQLAEKLSGKTEKMELVTIGLAYPSFVYDQHNLVKHELRGDALLELIDQDVFFQHVKNLDVCLFFYGQQEKDQLIPSGTFGDCINYGLPFIGLRSPYFAHYIAKYGDIGIQVDNVDEMNHVLIDLVNNPEKLRSLRSNIRRARREFGFRGFLENMRSIIEE